MIQDNLQLPISDQTQLIQSYIHQSLYINLFLIIKKCREIMQSVVFVHPFVTFSISPIETF